ncbi:MAG: exodeoxyribonuclease VII large subunit [Chitinophagales bacterium]|nr:exodeoxyribonuclease VII large subunit [Chitinophagales bacterium]
MLFSSDTAYFQFYLFISNKLHLKNNKTVFSLLEVTKSIQTTISKRYGSSFWVKAEMNKLNFYKHSGHCYPELVEKQNGKVIAQIKSILWKNDYDRVNQQFLSLLKEPLKDGIKILFEARITFDPVFGLSLIISDIDPSFTLGDLEAEKLATIQQLKKENLFHQNKTVPFPVLPQRLAIISVETSKGYADFIRIIDQNEWEYQFFHHLFPSLLQGDNAVKSIIGQLKRIEKVKHHFDVVAIIRGGGGDVGLACYNHYLLSREIATFPLPVITGIGHATNETVSDMVAHSNLITPTKVGEFLLQKFHNFSIPLDKAQNMIREYSDGLFKNENQKFNTEIKFFRSMTENVLLYNKNKVKNLSVSLLNNTKFALQSHVQRVNNLSQSISVNTKFAIQSQRQIVINKKSEIEKGLHYFMNNRQAELKSLEKDISHLHPNNVLKRGYSITFLNGKAVKDISLLKANDELETKVLEGSIKSIVKSVKKEDNE